MDNRRRTPQTPQIDWQRPWATKEDLRHDDAINVPCPVASGENRGEVLDVNYTTENVIESMTAKGFVGMVVNGIFIRVLYNAWAAQYAISGRLPDAVLYEHLPQYWFVPVFVETRRGLPDGSAPFVDVLTFWVRPRTYKAAKHRRNGSG